MDSFWPQCLPVNAFTRYASLYRHLVLTSKEAKHDIGSVRNVVK